MFIKAKVLNRQCVLSCSFKRCIPQCAPLVDQFAHMFAGDIKFVPFYTGKPLIYQAQMLMLGISEVMWTSHLRFTTEVNYYLYGNVGKV